MKSYSEILKKRHDLDTLLKNSQDKYSELTQEEMESEEGVKLAGTMVRCSGAIDILNWVLRKK